MTVTNQDLQLEDGGWAVNSRVTSASGAIIKAAPGADKFIRLQELGIYASAKCTVTVEASITSSASATITTIAGPISFGGGNFDYSRTYVRPIRLPANEEIRVRSSASALVNVYASGTIL